MGYIKEPDGVDFFVDSKPLTEKERKEISDIIAQYKLTGRKRKPSSTVHTSKTLHKQGTQRLEK